MGKTSVGHLAGASGQVASGEMQSQRPVEGAPPDGTPSESRKARKRDGDDADDGRIDDAEHLRQDFARVRAKAATDPALASQSLAGAWTTDVTVEEDEAEFVDAVADCLGAGLSLESALTGWDMGTLTADGGEPLGEDGSEDGSLFDDPSRDDEASPAAGFSPRHTPTGGRRFFIT